MRRLVDEIDKDEQAASEGCGSSFTSASGLTRGTLTLTPTLTRVEFDAVPRRRDIPFPNVEFDAVSRS